MSLYLFGPHSFPSQNGTYPHKDKTDRHACARARAHTHTHTHTHMFTVWNLTCICSILNYIIIADFTYCWECHLGMRDTHLQSGLFGKVFYRGSKSISSRSQCFIGTIRSLAAFVSQCGGVGRISLTRRVSLPSVSKSWAYSRGSSPFLWHSPFGNPVKIMASSQNDVFKEVN